MARWTKRAAVARANENTLLQEAMRMEPRLVPVIENARKQRRSASYNRIQRYVALKQDVLLLVGLLAEKPELRTSEYYDAVVRTIDDLLPPDDVDRDG